jgi:hypothetical protein
MTRPGKNQAQNFGTGCCTAAAILTIVFALAVAMSSPVQAQTYQVIHTFAGGQQGALPKSTLILDRAGNLYGTAGLVYKLTTRESGWVFTPLFNFPGGYDGSGSDAALVFVLTAASMGRATEAISNAATGKGVVAASFST